MGHVCSSCENVYVEVDMHEFYVHEIDAYVWICLGCWDLV
jgi:hypothetical protein